MIALSGRILVGLFVVGLTAAPGAAQQPAPTRMQQTSPATTQQPAPDINTAEPLRVPENAPPPKAPPRLSLLAEAGILYPAVNNPERRYQ